jgi:hypothetical protein
MAEQSKLPNAFNNGAYCKSALLPGESVGELKRLHPALIDELKPDSSTIRFQGAEGPCSGHAAIVHCSNFLLKDVVLR